MYSKDIPEQVPVPSAAEGAPAEAVENDGAGSPSPPSGFSEAQAEGHLVAALRLEAEQARRAAAESDDRHLRALADFENYRRRVQKDQADQINLANERLIREGLPVLDNLERALAHAKTSRDFDKMVEGIDLIYKQQVTLLEKFGVRVIESLGQPFDPVRHQSVSQTEAASPEQENRVVSEYQKGYMLHGRVLRPSMVVIGAVADAARTRGEDAPPPAAEASAAS